MVDSSHTSAASSGDDGNGDGNSNDKGAEPELPLVDFGVVVAGKERFDVCRLFLASLQLVGAGCWVMVMVMVKVIDESRVGLVDNS